MKRGEVIGFAVLIALCGLYVYMVFHSGFYITNYHGDATAEQRWEARR